MPASDSPAAHPARAVSSAIHGLPGGGCILSCLHYLHTAFSMRCQDATHFPQMSLFHANILCEWASRMGAVPSKQAPPSYVPDNEGLHIYENRYYVIERPPRQEK